MATLPLEVADIIREYRSDFVASRGGKIPTAHWRVLRHIASCRTASLGGHLEACDSCGHQAIAYNSCRNRHCPKCQASARFRWLENRQRDLLPVEYFHVVFTLPKEISTLALCNKELLYSALFQASAETLQAVARNPKYLGANLGVLSILHTWGQNLQHHPHVHCVVPGGGLTPDRSQWLSCRKGFLLPVRVLGRLFRGKFLARLREFYDQGRIVFAGSTSQSKSPKAFQKLLSKVYRKNWVVYSKPPFGGPEQVLKYLARYTHRVAIANSRLISMTDGNVTFAWKDYAKGCGRRKMTLSASEFLRRFLLHVLPKGFVRIRSYGFLANRCRRDRIACIRRLLMPNTEINYTEEPKGQDDGDTARPCPACKKGIMQIVGTVVPDVSISKVPRKYALPFQDPET